MSEDLDIVRLDIVRFVVVRVLDVCIGYTFGQVICINQLHFGIPFFAVCDSEMDIVVHRLIMQDLEYIK